MTAGRRHTGSATVLALHKVSRHFSFGSTNFSPRRFRQLLLSLGEWGYDFCSLSNVIEGTADANSCLITFDDGYQHLADVLVDLMVEFGFKPVVFVPTSFIGRENRWDYSHIFRNAPHLSKQSIKKLADSGVEFGSHGHRHVDLTSRSQAELHEELMISKSVLEDMTGKPVRSISYPFGMTNTTVLEAARDCGYAAGFTMRFPSVDDHALSMGRYAIYGYDTLFSIRRKLQPGPLQPIEKAKATLTNRLSGGTRLLNWFRGK